MRPVPKPKPKPKKVYKAAEMPEEILQELCENYLNQNDIAFIRIPDTLWNNKIPGYIRQAISKYLKGVPDLNIFFTNGTYICVELKTEIGRLSIGQKRFRNKVGHDNYYLVRSHEDFKKLVREKRNGMD